MSPYGRSVSLGPLDWPVRTRLEVMAATRVVEGIWKRDPTVWGGTGGTPELRDRLGWLDIAERFLKTHDDLTDFADSVRADCD